LNFTNPQTLKWGPTFNADAVLGPGDYPPPMMQRAYLPLGGGESKFLGLAKPSPWNLQERGTLKRGETNPLAADF
jgi:hypothetical protein